MMNRSQITPNLLRILLCLLCLSPHLPSVSQAQTVKQWASIDGSYWRQAPEGSLVNYDIQRTAYAGTSQGTRLTQSQQGTFPIEPGQQYHVTALASVTGQIGRIAQTVSAQVFNAQGQILFTAQSTPHIGHSQNKKIQLSFIAPETAAAVKLRVHGEVLQTLEDTTNIRFKKVSLWTDESLQAELQAEAEYLESIAWSGPEPDPVPFDSPHAGPLTEGILSHGKFYRYNRPPHESHPDTGSSRWSDGQRLTDPFIQNQSVGWSGSDPITVTLDLGRPQSLNQARITGRILLTPAGSAPQGILIQTKTKEDELWQTWSQATSPTTSSSTWQYTLQASTRLARYVSVTIHPGSGASPWTYLEQVELSGLIKNTWKHVPFRGAFHGAFPTSVAFDSETLNGRSGMVADLFENLVGKKLAMVLWYQGMREGRPFEEMHLMREPHLSENFYGCRYLSIGWEPQGLEPILSGALDDYLEQYFRDSMDLTITRGNTDPIWFRPMGEFNGSWVSWSLDPINFKRAWWRLYNIAEQVGATERHIFVWAPNHMSYPNQPWNQPENYYPGDQYVDWVGISLYPPSKSVANSEAQRYPVQNVAQIYDAYAHYKPFMVVEGAYDSTVDRVRFVEEWFNGIKEHRPKVKALVWENHNDRIISLDENALNRYRELVQDPYWLSTTWSGRENLLPNPDFESGNAEGWTSTLDGSYNALAGPSHVSPYVHSGAYSLRRIFYRGTTAGFQTAFHSQWIPAEAGKSYSLDLATFCNAPEGSVETFAIVTFYNANQQSIGSAETTRASSRNNTQWQRVSLQVTAPPGTRYIRVTASSVVHETLDKTIYAGWDDFQLREDSNFLINSGFESGDNRGWLTVFDGTYFQLIGPQTSSPYVERGQYAARRALYSGSQADSRYRLRSNLYDAEAHRRYILYASTKASGQSGRFQNQLLLLFLDTNENPIESVASQPVISSSSSDWRRLSVHAVSPPGTRYLQVIGETELLQTLNGLAYACWDDFRIITPPGHFDQWRQRFFSPEERMNPDISGPEVALQDDGLSNWEKMLYNMDPRQPGNSPVPTFVPSGNGFFLTFPAHRNRIYQLLESGDLIHWNTASPPIPSTGEIIQFPIIPPENGQTRFHRIRISLPEPGNP